MDGIHFHPAQVGMPLNKDPQGGGTNADGSKSNEYCSRCYVNGQFTRPDITTLEEINSTKRATLLNTV